MRHRHKLNLESTLVNNSQKMNTETSYDVFQVSVSVLAMLHELVSITYDSPTGRYALNYALCSSTHTRLVTPEKMLHLVY